VDGVIGGLATALIIAALGCAAWALGMVVLNRHINPVTLGLLALLEVALVVQAVIGIVNLATTTRQVAGGTFVGYLIASLIVLPGAVYWALGERSRWGTAALVVGCLVVPVMIVRMNQIWGHGG
jgi:hypothetical protein